MLDLTPIQQAVRQAASLCAQVQCIHLAHSDKGKDDPVTIADYGSQAILCRAIRRAFPEDAVLAEEQGSQFVELVPEAQRARILHLLGDVLGESVTTDDVVNWLDHGQGRQAARTWVIDPVDGTKGFLAQRHYCIAVGILEAGKPVGAVMGAPAYEGGTLFYAQDRWACRQSMSGGAESRVHVSSRSDPAAMRIVESVEEAHASHDRMKRVRELAGMSSAVVEQIDSQEKYALVACGYTDLYLRLPKVGSRYVHRVWDHAAGTALLQAAGGVVSDIDGSPLDFSRGKALPNKGMIVSNGHIHDRVVRATMEVMGEDRR
jgi:3'(2'), 5'-bisphosphate nucleotidase